MKNAKKIYFDMPGLGRVFSMPGSTFRPKGYKRDAVVADPGIAGYQEEHVPPEANMNITATRGIDMQALNNLTGINVTVELDTGDIYMMTDAWVADAVELNDGKISVKINARDSEKVN